MYSSKCLYAHDPPRSGTARYPHSRSFPERDIRFERTKNGVLQAKTNLGRRRKIGLFLRTGYHFEGKFHHLTEFKFSGERARTFMIPMAAGIGRTQFKKKKSPYSWKTPGPRYGMPVLLPCPFKPKKSIKTFIFRQR